MLILKIILIMLILGIDPGSRITGFGIIESNKRKQHYIASGCIKIIGTDWSLRLKQIYDDLLEIINKSENIFIFYLLNKQKYKDKTKDI